MPPTPIFVDDSGRRHRIVRVAGWLLGLLVVGYLSLLGVSLMASPDLLPLSLPSLGRVLPGPGAPSVAPAQRPVPTDRPQPSGATTAAAAAAGAAARASGPAAPQLTSATRVAPGRVAPASTPRTAAPRPTPTPAATAAAPAPSQSAAASPGSTPPSTSPSPHGKKSTHPTPHSTHAAAGTTR